MVMLMYYIRNNQQQNRLDFIIIKMVFASRGIKKRERDINPQNVSGYADHVCIAHIRIYKEHS